MPGVGVWIFGLGWFGFKSLGGVIEVQGVWVAFVARGVRFERFGSSSSSPSQGVRVRGVWVIVRLARFGSEGFESSSLRGFGWSLLREGGRG